MPMTPQGGPSHEVLMPFPISSLSIWGTIQPRTLNAGLLASLLACATRSCTSDIDILHLFFKPQRRFGFGLREETYPRNSVKG